MIQSNLFTTSNKIIKFLFPTYREKESEEFNNVFKIKI